MLPFQISSACLAILSLELFLLASNVLFFLVLNVQYYVGYSIMNVGSE